jgi:hypothetical protein
MKGDESLLFHINALSSIIRIDTADNGTLEAPSIGLTSCLNRWKEKVTFVRGLSFNLKYSSKLLTLACKRQRLNRLSIRLYVPRVITRFQEAKTLVVLPFNMPPREKTLGWKGRLLVGRWRAL